MLPNAYYSRSYEINRLFWRLIIVGTPTSGYFTRWQWREPDESHWFEILIFPKTPPKELYDIVAKEEAPALADYRMQKTPGDWNHPRFHSTPTRHSFEHLAQKTPTKPREK